VFSASATPDPDKALAACVWLWAREPSLCNAPKVAGPDFDASLQEGQLDVPAGARCVFDDGTTIQRNAVKRLTALTGDSGYAASVLLEQSVLAAAQPVSPDDVLSAERAVVQSSFGGDRTRYRAALARAGLTLSDGRAIIAARLERDRVEARFRPHTPTPQDVGDFLATYATQPVRLVATTERAPWLGGAQRGWAVSTLAPAQVFEVDGASDIDTPDGAFTVTPLGPSLPLGILPAAQAQAAARTMLELLERDVRYHAWLHAHAVQRLATATCLGDQVPTPMATDLSPFVGFLLPS
jgi:hypothetical protein